MIGARARMPIAVATAVIVAIIWAAPRTQAGCISRTIGEVTYHGCADGTSGTSRVIGNTTHHGFNGRTGTSRRIGSTTYHDFDGRGGTSRAIGGTTFHDGPLFGR
jgi:hypothetical protein